MLSFLLVGVMIYTLYLQKTEIKLSNQPIETASSSSFSHIPRNTVQIPQGVQLVKSLLGMEVKFLNGHVNYAGQDIIKDFRYQALANNEKLVDAIYFQPIQGNPFFLLIAIAKSQNGIPIIVPGKFDIVFKTGLDGFVLKDSRGRLFYYSGYLLTTSAWRNLLQGQTLQDKFCKTPNNTLMCSAKNTVNVVLKKPKNTNKDIPFLTLIP